MKNPEKRAELLAWKTSLKQAAVKPEALIQRLELDPSLLEGALAADRLFPLKAPEAWLKKIEAGNQDDPLLKQILPTLAEQTETVGFTADPLGEKSALKSKGILHKYKGRVLLLVSSACAINCRYCFRRSFPYEESLPGRQEWLECFDYIRADTSIQEVILSGGDPLVATDQQLKFLVDHLAAIGHVRTLRIHSRVPVVMPERVTAELLEILSGHRLKKVMVIHSNHPSELGSDTQAVLEKFKDRGFLLLNQSVLLKGVNDDAATLVRLSWALFEMGVLPYYLHSLDPVNGVAHFEVTLLEAKKLMHEVSSQLPGYLVPKFVQEVSGMPYKMPR